MHREYIWRISGQIGNKTMTRYLIIILCKTNIIFQIKIIDEFNTFQKAEVNILESLEVYKPYKHFDNHLLNDQIELNFFCPFSFV